MKPAINDDAPTGIKWEAKVTLEVAAVGDGWVELRISYRRIGQIEDTPTETRRLHLSETLTFQMLSI